MFWPMLLDWTPAFALVLARIGPAMMLLPGLGETATPTMMRIGLAAGLTVLLLPLLRPTMPPIPDSGINLGLMIAGEVFTGIWFGWLARQSALILPAAAQIVAFMTGLSSVLQPDPDLGPQTSALSKWFETMVPLLILLTNLYRLPLLALRGLFQLIPPGHMLPTADGLESVVSVVGSAFALAVQLATPFILIATIWNVAIGMLMRMAPRMQIYFVSAPGQMLAGFLALLILAEAMLSAWSAGAEKLLLALPGST
ncbi:MAG TPA: flagellar biosynthetic protein FliR [Rhodopila sp.]|nr:flagellar biosynthetic protein FliR [Rhodopila sp.]